jgi:hypothetical protein
LHSKTSSDESKSDEVAGMAKYRQSASTGLGDSLSILRFVRGDKSKRLEISTSGK